MCFAPDATPPPLPSGKSPLTGSDITVASTDGTKVPAYHVIPEEPNGRGVVVLPDIRGLYPFYKNLAGSFAAEGFEAIVLDYFARSDAPAERGPDFDPWPYVKATEVEQVQADINAAKSQLQASDVYAVGFCFGGGHAFALAAAALGFSGVVGFYGRPYSENPFYPSAIELTDRMSCPVLGLFGGGDNSIPADIVEQFDRELTDSKVPHDLHTYPGAPHSFFDRSAPEWEEACADAWRRTLDFLRA
ncbi:dienelactone hydrolase family protein [Epidermidibacterium keratini]|uniref:Dienelactone hydrolase family protein n=1 Tax=Epidermidibacterium keratini TaxID=1891644 RepID=A0A7L4YJG3_9ACTN|nr:alpha/beta fold hydrolase [Epidermidibacterium keratini]QHB99385.1 dienelactone hydrolase family protein [Epidermidibacterium keratini]